MNSTDRMTRQTHGSAGGRKPARAAFSLVEMLVTMVIISIVASLSLTGLAGARTRAKVAKSQSTIRKLHELVAPRYLEYLDCRLDDSGWDNFEYEAKRARPDLKDAELAAWMRLAQIRGMLAHEMPDQWIDVRQGTYPHDPSDPLSMSESSGPPGPPGTMPAVSRYLRYLEARVSAVDPARNTLDKLRSELGRTNASAETLHLLVSVGSLDTDSLESFRNDEIGDVDDDGASEFLDGFGRPIHFLRWAPGYFRERGQTAVADPFDPYRFGGRGGNDSFQLMPLLVSAGPDERFSLLREGSRSIEEQGDPRTAVSEGSQRFLPLPYDPFTPRECGQSDPSAAALARDNITNIGIR